MACKSFPEENGMMEMKGQQKQHPRFRDSSSDSNGIHSFTSAQRAQLVATVRRSYMEIERARLQKQLPSALVMKSSSSSTLRYIGVLLEFKGNDGLMNHVDLESPIPRLKTIVTRCPLPRVLLQSMSRMEKKSWSKKHQHRRSINKTAKRVHKKIIDELLHLH